MKAENKNEFQKQINEPVSYYSQNELDQNQHNQLLNNKMKQTLPKIIVILLIYFNL